MKQAYCYLPLSEEIRSRSLYVLSGGNALVPPDSPYPPPTHPAHHRFHWPQGRTLQEYQLLYITRGGGLLESTSAGRQQIVAGDLFILFPEEWHRYSPDSVTGWEEHWVAFHGKDAAHLVAELFVCPETPVLHTDAGELLVREFSRLEDELMEQAFGYQSVIAARIRLILALAAASHLRRNFESRDVLQIINRAKEMLLDQIDQTVSMETLAADLHVGYSWFRKMFRQYTGFSPAHYHMEIRLNHARDLLRTTLLPIAAIGRRSGFETAYHFARIFRAKVGYSPTEYRRMSQTR